MLPPDGPSTQTVPVCSPSCGTQSQTRAGQGKGGEACAGPWSSFLLSSDGDSASGREPAGLCSTSPPPTLASVVSAVVRAASPAPADSPLPGTEISGSWPGLPLRLGPARTRTPGPQHHRLAPGQLGHGSWADFLPSGCEARWDSESQGTSALPGWPAAGTLPLF